MSASQGTHEKSLREESLAELYNEMSDQMKNEWRIEMKDSKVRKARISAVTERLNAARWEASEALEKAGVLEDKEDDLVAQLDAVREKLDAARKEVMTASKKAQGALDDLDSLAWAEAIVAQEHRDEVQDELNIS